MDTLSQLEKHDLIKDLKSVIERIEQSNNTDDEGV